MMVKIFLMIIATICIFNFGNSLSLLQNAEPLVFLNALWNLIGQHLPWLISLYCFFKVKDLDRDISGLCKTLNEDKKSAEKNEKQTQELKKEVAELKKALAEKNNTQE